MREKSKDFLDYIEDVILAMDQIIEFTKDIEYDDFIADDKSISAVERKLEIIGEAVKKVPVKIKKKYPEIPWKDISGMRDKLIHEYFGVDLKRVWITAKVSIPEVKPKFEQILKDFR